MPSKKQEALAAPTFANKKELARYIHPNFRMRGNRASSLAFELDAGPPRERYLSVNSLEVERVKTIATYYSSKFESNAATVAISQQKIIDYNLAAKKAGIALSMNNDGQWECAGGAGKSPAYRHRPVTGTAMPSPSHCGVEFLYECTETIEKKFAVHMARAKFHLVGVND